MILNVRKAGTLACFFLLIHVHLLASDNLWKFDSELQKGYLYVLNLQPELALEYINKVSSKSEYLHKLYVLSLHETVDVLITEDPKKFDQMEINFKQRLNYIEKLPESAETIFLQAELNLQRGFNLLNSGQEFNAVFAIRRAYNFTQMCLKKYPQFVPIRKTNGVIQVMIGAVPDKYQWFMNLLGMKGSVVYGQKQLNELRSSESSLKLEATILFFTIKGFINQKFDESAKGLMECLNEQPENRLLLFLSINMLVKDSQAEKALELIQVLDKHSEGLQVYYIEYLRGEVLLEKGEYHRSIMAYQKFLKGYRSFSFKKDSHFKIGLCYWLLNDPRQAKEYFDKAKTVGRDQAEPDKYAAIQLEDPAFPNQKLLKTRFYTDGGYYKEAESALQSIKPAELKTLKDKTEFFYRKARLAHKLREVTAAKIFYQQTIDMTKNNPWYFGANSALQLGYIAVESKDIVQAKKYFELALSYKHHEYKNSIDSKARFALDQIKNPK